MKHIIRAFRRKKEKGYPKLYIGVDLHDVIINGTYTRLNVGAEVHPVAKEVLAHWTKREDVCLILWTPSHEDALEDIKARLAADGIVFNYICENPEIPTGELCDFGKKWYFDILLEDKAGFDMETDWQRIKEALIELGEWNHA